MESKFNYSYSAGEQEEIKRIREKYLFKEDNKLEQLRRLDAGVTKKPTMIAIVLGVLGCLIFGAGMSFVLVGGGDYLLPGSIVGIVGIVNIVLAYPIYAKLLKKEKERLAPEILRLTEELMK